MADHADTNTQDQGAEPSADAPATDEGAPATTSDDQPEATAPDPLLATAVAALEGLTSTVELLGAMGAQAADARLAPLATELKTTAEALLARAGVEPAATGEGDRDTEPAEEPSDAKDGDAFAENLQAARAALTQLAALTSAPASEAEAEPASRTSFTDRLPGGGVVWVFVVVELITFAMFFGAFAVGYAADPATFSAAQERLSPMSATVNTIVLLTGSWFAARAVAAVHARRPSPLWMAGVAASGLLFSVIKIVEYTHSLAGGITLSTNAFWFSYLFLTVMHLLHVLAGVAFALVIAVQQWRARSGAPTDLSVEATATYWHLVDLIWIFLFPLLYLSEGGL